MHFRPIKTKALTENEIIQKQAKPHPLYKHETIQHRIDTKHESDKNHPFLETPREPPMTRLFPHPIAKFHENIMAKIHIHIQTT